MKAQDIWNANKELLKRSYVERSFAAWSDLWAEDGRFVAEFGSQGPDGYIEEQHVGREEIVDFFSGSSGRIEIDLEDDGSVYEAKDSPGLFMVISDFVATLLATSDPYRNRTVSRISYDSEDRITEFIEYTDPIRRQNFLRALNADGS